MIKIHFYLLLAALAAAFAAGCSGGGSNNAAESDADSAETAEIDATESLEEIADSSEEHFEIIDENEIDAHEYDEITVEEAEETNDEGDLSEEITDVQTDDGGEVEEQSEANELKEETAEEEAEELEKEEPLGSVVISDFYVIENPANVLSFFVEYTTDKACATDLRVACDFGYDQNFTGSDAVTSHKLFVMGLVTGANCRFTAAAKDENNLYSYSDNDVTVSPLPEILPAMELVKKDESMMYRGWTLFNLSNVIDSIPLMVAMVDEEGRYRWYYMADTESSGSDNAVSMTPQGVLIGGTVSVINPQIVNFEGAVVWTEPVYMHHEIKPFGGGKFIFLGADTACDPVTFKDVMWTDTIEIWDVETRTTTWRWLMCQHYAPPVIEVDWDHINSIDKFPNENALLISSRGQDALFKVNMDDGGVIWRLGKQGDFAMDEGDLFYRQHDATFLPNGNILLFDNGKTDVRPFSRAIEIQFDETEGAKTAKVVWQYAPNPVIFTDIWSGARLLPNGNRLITFGVYSDVASSYLIEVTGDAQPAETWMLKLPYKWGVYRSQRVDGVYGYVKK